MKQITAENIAKAMGVNHLKAFEPVAYYDKHTDCIRIELRDCSFAEERFNEHVTFLEDNYPSTGRNPIAGIMLKGVKHLFTTNNIPLEGIVYVTKIMNEFVKQYPELAQERICQLVNEMDLPVNLSEPDDFVTAAAA